MAFFALEILMKAKSAALDALKLFLADASPYGSPKVLRSDNGSEFTSTAFRNVLIEKGIRQEFSAPYCPHQNGTTECPWRTLYVDLCHYDECSCEEQVLLQQNWADSSLFDDWEGT
jgi:transposase InsO family protein